MSKIRPGYLMAWRAVKETPLNRPGVSIDTASDRLRVWMDSGEPGPRLHRHLNLLGRTSRRITLCGRATFLIMICAGNSAC